MAAKPFSILILSFSSLDIPRFFSLAVTGLIFGSEESESLIALDLEPKHMIKFVAVVLKAAQSVVTGYKVGHTE